MVADDHTVVVSTVTSYNQKVLLGKLRTIPRKTPDTGLGPRA